VLRVLMLAMLASCSYKPAFRDCDISCAAPTDCPDNFTCGPENFCRASGVSASCDAVRDARDSEDAPVTMPVDAKVVDAPAIVIDAPPPGNPGYYGCFAVADNTYTCNEMCASESRTCTTACGGKVWYAYSLAGPCAASQPTSFSGASCTQKAAIGTGDTIYVQCCCQ
jgi:hypothetical protein